MIYRRAPILRLWRSSATDPDSWHSRQVQIVSRHYPESDRGNYTQSRK